MGCACARSQTPNDTKSDIKRKNVNPSDSKLGGNSNPAGKYQVTSSNVQLNTANPSNYNQNTITSTSGVNLVESSNSKNGSKNSSSIIRKVTSLFIKDHRNNNDYSPNSSQTNISPNNNNNHGKNSNPVNPNTSAIQSNCPQISVSIGNSTPQNTRQTTKTQIPNGIYSLLNLPLRTQYLLNSQNEFEIIDHSASHHNTHQHQHHNNNSKNTIVKPKITSKTSREIKIYLSSPFLSNNNNSNNNKSELYANLFSSRHNNFNNQTNSLNPINESVYTHLRTYCAQEIHNCDLNIIDLNDSSDLSSTTATASSCLLVAQETQDCCLITNKYYRRLLGKIVLNDLLNISTFSLNNNASRYLNNYSASYCLFVIYLSDVQFEQDNNLLCPDEIEISDYKNYIEKYFTKTELELFSRWYKLNSTKDYYKLNIDFKNITNVKMDELDSLFDLFSVKFEEISRLVSPNLLVSNDNNSTSSTSDMSNETAADPTKSTSHSFNNKLKLKYLRSIQQEEIEFIISNIDIDSSSIIWFHLISGNSSSSSSSSLSSTVTSHLAASSSSSLPNTSHSHQHHQHNHHHHNSHHKNNNNTNIINSFNNLRYINTLKLLQSQVLKHNYQQLNTNNNANLNNPKSTNNVGHHNHHLHNSTTSSNEKLMNEFIFNQTKSLIDAYISELNKSLVDTIALKIDKQLAQELYKHYELYKYHKNLISFSNNLKSKSPSSSPSRSSPEFKFNSLINDYLNEKNTKYPLILYTSSDSSNKFDYLVSNWIKKSIEQQLSNRSIVYRFCKHTILSSEVTSLVQSITHQLCYLIEIHESWAFTSPSNLIDNLCKALDYHIKRKQPSHSMNDSEPVQLVIILNRIDRLLLSEYDQNLFLNLLNKIYYNDSSLNCSHLKLVCTYSTESKPLKSLPLSTPAYNFIKRVETVFRSSSDKTLKFFSDSSSMSSSTSLVSLSRKSSTKQQQNQSTDDFDLNVHLRTLLLNQNTTETSTNLIDGLVQLLTQTRYGLKECELVDLIRLFTSKSSQSCSSTPLLNSSSGNPSLFNIDHLILIIWYSIKYYPFIFNTNTNLIESLTDNNQILYRLEISKSSNKSVNIVNLNETFTETKEQAKTKLNNLVYTYYQNAIDKFTYSPSTKSSNPLSHFNIRVYHELPIIYYHNSVSSNQQHLERLFLNQFILNHKWIYNKSTYCSNSLYLIHDFELFKKLFKHQQQNSAPDDEADENSKEELDLVLSDEFRLYEFLFYKIIFNLYQDSNQIYLLFNSQLSLLGKLLESINYNNKENQFLTKLNNDFEFDKILKLINNNNSHNPMMIPLNFDYIFMELNEDQNELKQEKIVFNSLDKKETYYSHVAFLSANCVLTLSDSQNEIKIWKVVITNNEQKSKFQSVLQLMRSIKLNKPPKDLRLINKTVAVVLVDRNLHLIDLNYCKHSHDMNSTMNPSNPLFEIHDQNHVVLLARNRLSIILMKVPLEKISNESENDAETSTDDTEKLIEKQSCSGGQNEDMFLFKVGEDRYLNSLLVSKNGHIMVCGDEVQKPFPLLVWNLNQRKLIYDLRQQKHEFITSIQSISSSGRYVVCGCQEEGESNNCLIVYDLNTGQLFKKIKAKVNYVCVEISEESSIIIACLENAQIILYELTNGSKKFTLNSNRYPINKIKILDSNKNFKNYFLTYDTTGCDWTIRLWDLNKGDTLIASYTCPSRIVSCSVNLYPLYFNDDSKSTADDDLLIAVSLYGVKQLLILRLTNSVLLKKSSLITNQNNNDIFSKNESLIGLHTEINL